jgi:hypothetical protein
VLFSFSERQNLQVAKIRSKEKHWLLVAAHCYSLI